MRFVDKVNELISENLVSIGRDIIYSKNPREKTIEYVEKLRKTIHLK